MVKVRLPALVLVVFILAACAPSSQAIQTAIAQTQAVWTKVPTQTAYPTITPRPTITPWPTATIAPTATVGPGSMLNPYPMMTASSMMVNNPGEVDFTVTVLQVARGPQVDAYATSNFPGVSLPSGMQFIFVKVDVNITSVTSGSSYKIDSTNFQSMSDGQLSPQEFMANICFQCDQYPLLSANYVAPGHTTGWVMLQVFTDDSHPLMVMGPFYFSLE
jgi:hypothetical protein